MKTVWKFQVWDRSEREQVVDMPIGAQIVHAGMQGDRLFVWAIVDDASHYEKRRFVVRGTSWEVADGLVHVATVQDGGYVWHLFEIK